MARPAGASCLLLRRAAALRLSAPADPDGPHGVEF
jgi:hypothetical protein